MPSTSVFARTVTGLAEFTVGGRIMILSHDLTFILF